MPTTNQPKKCPEYRPSINNGYPCLNCAKPREDHTGLATPVESRLGECSIHEDEHFKNERCRDFTLTRATSAAEQLRDAKEVIPPTPQPEPTAELAHYIMNADTPYDAQQMLKSAIATERRAAVEAFAEKLLADGGYKVMTDEVAAELGLGNPAVMGLDQIQAALKEAK